VADLLRGFRIYENYSGRYRREIAFDYMRFILSRWREMRKPVTLARVEGTLALRKVVRPPESAATGKATEEGEQE
jgi:hypothetical protein